jgi:hypothetical protein
MTAAQAKAILDRSTLDGSAYGLEMLLISLIGKARLVQVPINYHPRVGVSSVTGKRGKTISLGLEMLGLTLRMRLRSRRIRRGRMRSRPILRGR